MRESLSRLPIRVFVLFALLVTVWLWGWFFIQGITYLDQWHLSLRDALITGVSLLILQIAVKQPLYSRLWRGAWLPFMAWILIFSFVIGQGHGNQVADYRLINPYLLGGQCASLDTGPADILGDPMWEENSCGLCGSIVDSGGIPVNFFCHFSRLLPDLSENFCASRFSSGVTDPLVGNCGIHQFTTYMETGAGRADRSAAYLDS